MSTSRDILLSEIDRFLQRSGMTEPAFGKRAMNDSKFVRRLRGGASCSLDTADKLRAFMKAFPRPLARRRNPAEGAAA